MSHKEMSVSVHSGLWSCVYAHLIHCWKLWLNMVSKSGRTTDFSKEEKLLMAALGREFPETKM